MNEELIRQLDTLQRRFDNLVKPEVPVPPLFSAYVSSTINNVTGDGTTYTVIFDTEIFDVDGNYNNANGIFTAPVAGKYLLVGSSFILNCNASHLIYQSSIITSNRTYYGDRYYNIFTLAGSSLQSGKCIAIADMDAADTAYYTIIVTNNTKTVALYGGASMYTYLQGYMLI